VEEEKTKQQEGARRGAKYAKQASHAVKQTGMPAHPKNCGDSGWCTYHADAKLLVDVTVDDI
jgi:hypothetical protein